MKRLLIIGALLLMILPAGVQAQETEHEIVVIQAEGPVTPAFAGYISRGIHIADERNAEALIVELNTPGGAVDTTFAIVQEMTASDVPIVVYVSPSGATAGSAGLLITLAGHASAMAPNTAIGASSPVSARGADLGSTLEQKQKEIIAAEARALASGRSEEAIAIANDAVFKAKAVSGDEAVEAGLVDFLATDREQLLAELDGFTITFDAREYTLTTADASIHTVGPNIVEQFLMFIINPNVVAVFFLVGIAGVVAEVAAPGGWAAGAVGITCLGFALYGFGVLPINGLGLVFILMALVLGGLELAAPGVGLLGASGIVSLLVGVVVLFQDPAIAQFGELSIPFVIGLGVLAAVGLGFWVHMAISVRRQKPLTGAEGLVGEVGRVIHPLDPEGTVFVQGERWTARVEDGRRVPQGGEVTVQQVDGMRLIVTPLE